MKIWRMKADGSEQEQVTSDPDYADWFPHPSPDGKLLVFLSYDKSVQGHPANKDVSLRIMALPDGKPQSPGAGSSAGRARSTCPPGRPTAGPWRSSATGWSLPERRTRGVRNFRTGNATLSHSFGLRIALR